MRIKSVCLLLLTNVSAWIFLTDYCNIQLSIDTKFDWREIMSDYGSIYLIETTYNSERDATEVIFGYMEKEKSLAGRSMSVRLIVNVPGCKDNEKKAINNYFCYFNTNFRY